MAPVLKELINNPFHNGMMGIGTSKREKHTYDQNYTGIFYINHKKATQETIKQIAEYNPTNIILIPLYPQFSTTTTASFLGKWNLALSDSGLTCPQKITCCYYSQKEFISSITKIFKQIQKMSKQIHEKCYKFFT